MLLHELPALTKFYGLRPWEVEALTIEELHVYRTQLAKALANGDGGES